MPTTDDYLALVTSWHSGKPKFAATLRAFLDEMAAVQDLLVQIREAFDLDTAIGVQLDAVGEWVGLSRYLPAPLTGVYFSLDTAGLGFDEGVWRGPFDPVEGLVRLDDTTYRLFLRFKIAANRWDGTMEGAADVLADVFAGSAAPGALVFIEDHQDMTATIGVSGGIIPQIYRELLIGGYLPLKPCGVRVNYVLGTVDAPLFGFDMSTAVVAGFDTGGWGATT